MHIATVWKSEKQFNVEISSKEGADPFLSIRGCRIVSGKDGEFVSFPATKKDDGKWWNHVWANDKFGKTVLDLAKAAQAPKKSYAGHEDDIPF